MSGEALTEIFRALDEADVRYLVVGGVAVVLHGHPRFTADLDLVLDLAPSNAFAAIGALETLGYRPRAPVPAGDFANEEIRAAWRREKGLTVFSLWSPSHPGTEVDLFVNDVGKVSKDIRIECPGPHGDKVTKELDIAVPVREAPAILNKNSVFTVRVRFTLTCD